jgi:hypothetical protein
MIDKNLPTVAYIAGYVGLNELSVVLDNYKKI